MAAARYAICVDVESINSVCSIYALHVYVHSTKTRPTLFVNVSF